MSATDSDASSSTEYSDSGDGSGPAVEMQPKKRKATKRNVRAAGAKTANGDVDAATPGMGATAGGDGDDEAEPEDGTPPHPPPKTQATRKKPSRPGGGSGGKSGSGTGPGSPGGAASRKGRLAARRSSTRKSQIGSNGPANGAKLKRGPTASRSKKFQGPTARLSDGLTDSKVGFKRRSSVQEGQLTNPDQQMREQHELGEEEEVAGIYILLESASNLVNPVDIEVDEEQEEYDDEDDVSINAGKLNPMVTFTLGKANQQSRRKRDTPNPIWKEELFLPFNERAPEATMVLEVFGNARIFRLDGRLGREFLGGAVFDVSAATAELQDIELKLLHSDQIEPLLPKSFKNRDRYKDAMDHSRAKSATSTRTDLASARSRPGTSRSAKGRAADGGSGAPRGSSSRNKRSRSARSKSGSKKKNSSPRHLRPGGSTSPQVSPKSASRKQLTLPRTGSESDGGGGGTSGFSSGGGSDGGSAGGRGKSGKRIQRKRSGSARSKTSNRSARSNDSSKVLREDIGSIKLSFCMKKETRKVQQKSAKRKGQHVNAYYDDEHSDDEDPDMIKYKDVELKIKAYVEAGEDTETAAMWGEIWAKYDYPGLGMLPLGRMHKIVADQFPLIRCRHALLRAAQRSNDVLGTATRRTWISEKSFPDLLANFYFMKRFYDIVPDSLHNPEKRVEYREFKYLMKRCGGHGDSQAWFISMAEGGSSILLDDAAGYIARRTFFPKHHHHHDDGKSALGHMTFAERMKARANDRKTERTKKRNQSTTGASLTAAGPGNGRQRSARNARRGGAKQADGAPGSANGKA